MTKTELMADLEHASRIARDGATAPLVGGPVGLWWGVMLTLTFALHYALITGTLPAPVWSPGPLWAGFALIGTAGSLFIGSKIASRPGASSMMNKVEQYGWMMFGCALASMAVGVLLNIILNDGSVELWTIILIAGFAGQGLVYGLTAKLTGHGWLHFAALAGFTMAAVTMAFYNDAIVYLIAAIGTVVTIIIPSVLSMRKAAG